MKQVYYLQFISRSGLESKKMPFESLSMLYQYLKIHEKFGDSYLITKEY